MNKPTLSLAEVAQRIVLERKFNKMIAEVALAIKASTRMLNEAGLPTGIDKSILAATKEVEAAGKDISDENVQAALVMAALEKNGDLSKVGAQDVEAVMEKQGNQGKQSLGESAGGVVGLIEAGSVFLGNLALIETACEVFSKVLGKKIDPSSFKAGLATVLNRIKKVTGFPMRVLGNVVTWIVKKLGGSVGSQKVAASIVKMIFVMALFILAFKLFPIAGVSAMGIALSVTGLIGKGLEIVKLFKEFSAAMDERDLERGILPAT